MCAKRSSNIFNSSEATEITKKRHKNREGVQGARQRGVYSMGRRLQTGWIKSTPLLRHHIRVTAAPALQPPPQPTLPPVSALPVVNKQSDTVLTVETLGSRLRDTGGKLWRNITPTGRFLFRPGKQQTPHSGVALSVTSANLTPCARLVTRHHLISYLTDDLFVRKRMLAPSQICAFFSC